MVEWIKEIYFTLEDGTTGIEKCTVPPTSQLRIRMIVEVEMERDLRTIYALVTDARGKCKKRYEWNGKCRLHPSVLYTIKTEAFLIVEEGKFWASGGMSAPEPVGAVPSECENIILRLVECLS